MKWHRIALAFPMFAAILYVASLATRDCSVTPYFAVNCVGLWVEQRLGLPSSRLVRGFILEVIGLFLAAGLYLTFRFAFPRAQSSSPSNSPASFPPSGRESSDAKSIQNAENLILRALAQEEPNGSLRAMAKVRLAAYRWQDTIHEEVYRALLASPVRDPDSLRSLLAVRLTRRGFPDFDLEDLFQPLGISKEQATILLDSLAKP